jgi:hypothetical protein
MKAARYLSERTVAARGIKALHRELGPVETQRFLSMANHKREDGVEHHRKWQDSLDAEDFIGQLMLEYKK